MGQTSLTDFIDLQGSDSLELLSNDRIAELTKLDADRVWKSTRVRQRFILRQGKEPLDLAHEVLDRFLEKTQLGERDIEALALVHTDYNAGIHDEIGESIASRIGIDRDHVRSMSLGCVGFVKVLEYASSIAHTLSDEKHCLILNVETPDRYIDARDSRAAPIFAAGATATSLWNGPGHSLLFAESRDITPPENPKKEDLFSFVDTEAEDFFGQRSMRTIVRMNGDLAYVNGSALIEKATRESLERVMSNEARRGRGVTVVPHQANAKMIRAFQATVSETLRSERPEWNIPRLNFVNGMEGMSNVISCTIPSVLARLHKIDGVVPPQDGDIVLTPAAGICMENPGSKMSMGIGALEWHPDAYKR